MTKTMQCIYFKRDGYCAKEKYCTFSHIKQERSSRDVGIAKAPNESVSASFSASTTAKIAAPNESRHLKFGQIDNLWDHSAVDRSIEIPQGVYYYGAPGRMSASTVTSAKAPYAAVARSGDKKFESDELSDMFKSVSLQGTTTATAPCRFFALGSCRFGHSCKFSHILDRSSEATEHIGINDLHRSDTTSTVECGICISVPTIFGILSNCDCVFCLECIRDWRKDGLSVVKTSEQVRRCPLCTKETYFICPSPKYVMGNDKDELIATYKESLLAKECKHFKMGTCPFGTSCFYLHVNKDGVIEEKKNRKLFTADKDYPVYSTMRISDFIVDIKK